MPVGFYDWMLALHVLSAFLMAAALLLFAALVIRGRQVTMLDDAALNFRLGSLGGILIGVGAVLALLLGIVLAIHSEDYHPWDGWLIAAYVLWALIGAVGGRSGRYYGEAQRLAETEGRGDEAIAMLRAPTGAVLNWVATGLFVLLLLDMLFKPGA